jgi:hypothetical protein
MTNSNPQQSKLNVARVKSLKAKRNDSQGLDKKDKAYNVE